jgi:acyl-coenzyme A thioesterase PaaI-like protein
MQYKVKRKQFNAKDCFVCGLDNQFGLHASFYELENGELVGIFKPGDLHQSFPNRLHGGIITAILDETIGRAIMINHDDAVWGVTAEFTTRYRIPVPLNVELRVRARITRDGRIFEGTGEILLPDGSVAAEGRGKYVKLPLEKISDSSLEEHWRIVQGEDEPTEFGF